MSCKNELTPSESASKAMQHLNDGAYDFLDFGCSSGGSMSFAKKYLGGNNGLGLDINTEKVKETQANGFDAVAEDILSINIKNCVRFEIMSHFLEHVEHADVPRFIKKASDLATDFIFIQQPSFENSYELLQRGLKMTYSDWRGHRNSYSGLDFYKLCQQLRSNGTIEDFSLGYFRKVNDSSHDRIVPLSSPTDTVIYSNHLGEKAEETFNFELFEEISLIITLRRGFDHIHDLGRRDKTIYSSISQ